MEDVARRAEVSVATVSNVLNSRGRVSAATRERVHAAIAELRYVPSAQGRSLAMGRSWTVGLVLPRRSHVGADFAPLIAGLTRVLREEGYHILVLSGGSPMRTRLAPGGRARSDIEELGELTGSGRIDGLVMSALEDDATRAWASQAGFPIVVFGTCDSGCPSVDVDRRAAARLAVGHLVDLGHRRIGVVDLDTAGAAERDRGIEEALDGQAVTIAAVTADELSVKGGAAAARRLLTGPDRPTAIMTSDDVLAEGVLRCVAGMGVSVPEQLSVVGYGNVGGAGRTTPPLTTVSPGWQEVGAALGRAIVGRIAGEAGGSARISPTMIVRESTAPVGSFATPAVPATAPVFKSGAAFAVLSADLLVDPGAGHHGVYLGDTRMLSLYQMRVDGRMLTPQSISYDPDGAGAVATYVMQQVGATRRLRRQLRLWPGRFEDRWHWEQWGRPAAWTMELNVGSDFHDIFEAREFVPSGHGTVQVTLADGVVRSSYAGRDGVTRTVEVSASMAPARLLDDSWRWPIPADIAEGDLTVTVGWTNPALPLPGAAGPGREDGAWPEIETSDPGWNATIARGRADIGMLMTDWGDGPAPMAGLPWFGALFGRDAIITALELLEWFPWQAEQTVGTLARLQATTWDARSEQEPGKILHELRHGELARLGEVPFGRYYGSVDVTPLFISLAAATWRRTGDTDWFLSVLPAVEAALAWVRAQRDASGLFVVDRRSQSGPVIQSWKDSSDSMVFANGEHGQPPFAISEVQGYAYQALRSMAGCYRMLGREAAASDLEAEAAAIRVAFHDRFWLEDARYYALAVDALGRPLDALSSDPGQCLWTGIVPPAYRRQVAERLMSPELFSGWGIRTLGSSAAHGAGYDPYSYHRGSVWPHDTALVVAGLYESGAVQEGARLASALIDAASRFPGHRLPELFAGEDRGQGGPFPYPGACSPQAWAAGAPLLALQATLGLRIDHHRRVLRVKPHLPDGLAWVRVRGITVDGARTDVSVEGGQVTCRGLPDGWTLSPGPP